MANLEKIVEDLNIPKQLLDKGTELAKTLFGPAFTELGDLFADQIRAIRAYNQVRIFSKAQKNLKERGIDPKGVSLKLLTPLLEFTALEEEESLQEKWANLVTHIFSGNKDAGFQQNCITILSRLSADEAILIDQLHSILSSKRLERHRKEVELYDSRKTRQPNLTLPKKPEDYSLNSLIFNVSATSKQLNISASELEFSLSNFISLGLFRWDTEVNVEATKVSEDPDDSDIDVDVSVYNFTDFVFTPVGDRFVKVCKGSVELL